MENRIKYKKPPPRLQGLTEKKRKAAKASAEVRRAKSEADPKPKPRNQREREAIANPTPFYDSLPTWQRRQFTKCLNDAYDFAALLDSYNLLPSDRLSIEREFASTSEFYYEWIRWRDLIGLLIDAEQRWYTAHGLTNPDDESLQRFCDFWRESRVEFTKRDPACFCCEPEPAFVNDDGHSLARDFTEHECSALGYEITRESAREKGEDFMSWSNLNPEERWHCRAARRAEEKFTSHPDIPIKPRSYV